MNRRRLLAAGIAAAVAWRQASAAPKASARVGYLELVKASDGEVLYREFVEAMRGRGYVDGGNLRMMRRSGEGQPERLRPLAAEMAAAKVDVILAASLEAARGARVAAPRNATVFVVAGDPILEGLVTSLSRPSGNLTGLVTRDEELAAKRLQLLKEAFPRIRSVAVVGSNLALSRAAFDDAARQIQIDVLHFPVHRQDDYRDAAAAIARSGADAVLVVEDADALTNLSVFVQLMMATRRPVMFNTDRFVESDVGGLMAYGVSLREVYRRAAYFAARLLEGVKPADLPVELPTRYELVINARAVDVYSIALPREFLLRADRVIR